MGLLLLACLLAAGCSGGSLGHEVSGTVKVDGAPPSIGAGERAELKFTSMAGASNVFSTGVQPDGKFFAELPPAKYKVSLEIFAGGKDKLEGKFNVINSKTEVEITGAKSDLVIEFK